MDGYEYNYRGYGLRWPFKRNVVSENNRVIALDILEDKIMAYQTGLGLAKFHWACSDLDSNKLETSIKDFHNTKFYIDQFNMIVKDYIAPLCCNTL